MEIIDTIPKELEAELVSENLKALRKLKDKNKAFSMVIPMHIANMNVLTSEKTEEIVPVIVPPINVYINKKYHKDGLLERHSMEYHVAYNDDVFPFGHVYQSSGTLCLGNIFVPQFIPEHSPLVPLETLFLHNDRNTNHGGAYLSVSKDDILDICDYLKDNNMEPIIHRIEPAFHRENIVQTDAIWLLSHLVLTHCDKQEEAYKHMDNLYKQLFK